MIRWRQKRDDSRIVELVRTLLVPISPWQHSKDRQLYSEITRRLRTGETLILARTSRSPPLAFLHMKLHYPTLLIDLLAVDSKYQNKHWGTELMQHAEQYGRKRGFTRTHLFVDEDNVRAQRFYYRLGYRIHRFIPSLRVYELIKELDAHYA